MEEQIQKLYQWSLSNNHIPADLAYETFAKKVGSEQGLRAYYDRLAARAAFKEHCSAPLS